MLGASRSAFIASRDALAQAMHSGADWTVLGDELFAVTEAVDGSASLRRALADPSREASAKRQLVSRLFSGKITGATAGVLEAAVSQRWSADRDLTDTTESLAVETVVASAEAGNRLDNLEDELFRFGRVVAGTPALREALADRNATGEEKAALVGELLDGKVTPETARLARQAVLAPRGRRFDRVLESYLAVAARHREQLTATVIAAVPLDDTQRGRLARALGSIYGRAIQVNVVVDPQVLGGIRVQIGDEVVDGTILRRLDEATRALTG
jgi:F-type H+-transporting ATPase subunit delta